MNKYLSNTMCAMLVCGGLLVGCSNSTEESYNTSYEASQARSAMEVIEMVKDSKTTEEDTDDFGFSYFVDRMKEEGLINAKLTGVDYKHKVVVLTSPKGDKVGEEWYDYLTTKEYETHDAKGYPAEFTEWEMFASVFGSTDSTKGFTFYVEFPDKKGDVVAVLEWHSKDSYRLIQIH